ncbi:hypothetical protein Salat_2776900 [Sesamum alatum]|uniref:Uncharacterized protein n=1 Tax=Sesamum alatum TaxID=300844 RepID=A0AAE1XLP5_9LAMI|nr:hypothetical protein Salat_2776900 [Sesamum alatum]
MTLESKREGEGALGAKKASSSGEWPRVQRPIKQRAAWLERLAQGEQDGGACGRRRAGKNVSGDRTTMASSEWVKYASYLYCNIFPFVATSSSYSFHFCSSINISIHTPALLLP